MNGTFRWIMAAIFVSTLGAAAPAVDQTCSTWCGCDDTPKLRGCTSVGGMVAQVCGNAEPVTLPMGCVCVGDNCVNNLDPTNVENDPTFFMGCPSLVSAFCD